MDFNQIEITTAELRLLKRLACGSCDKSESFDRLLRFKLAIENYVLQTDGYVMGDGTIEITDAGRDYLVFVAAKKRDKKVEWIRYVITTAIAVAAIVIATIALLSQLQILELPKSKSPAESSSIPCVPTDFQSDHPANL